VQSRRNKQAAIRFLRRLLTEMRYVPRVIVTDKLKSYGAAIKELKLEVDHRQHKDLNNRAENSHQPTRQRERAMRRFKSPKQAQPFLAPFGVIMWAFSGAASPLKSGALPPGDGIPLPDVARGERLGNLRLRVHGFS
jgi:putative transposase